MSIMIEGNAWTVCPGANQREFPSSDSSSREIWGYFDALSYWKNDLAQLWVHTTAPFFDMTVTRDGAAPVTVLTLRDCPGRRQKTPEDAFAVGCGWEDPVLIQTGNDWPPGAYAVKLIARYADGSRAEGEAFFALKRPPGEKRPDAVLVLTTSTWTAYNDWGGANHYRSVVDGKASDAPAPVLSRRRPWARGFIELPAEAPRHTGVPDLPRFGVPAFPWLTWALNNGYSRHYLDAGWAHYERPFVVWAENNGYDLDVITQDDLHADPACLTGYKTAIFVGHDEYWSADMRATVDAFVDSGGAVARFAGNFIWQVRIEGVDGDPHALQVCYKAPEADPLFRTHPSRTTTFWDSAIVNRPGAATFGVTGAQGCYARFGLCSPRGSGAFTVYRPFHWALTDTDLQYGDLLGPDPSRIATFELDGVDYTFRQGLPYATGIDGAPENLEIIALAPATLGERVRPGVPHAAPLAEVQALEAAAPTFYASESAMPREYGSGVVASFTRHRGEVFCAGACHWVNGLIHHDEAVEIITRNVLNRFAKRGHDALTAGLD
jgi:hypothetical protein